MIRLALQSDKHALFELARGLAAQYYPELQPDISKINEVLTEILHNKSHFALVSCSRDEAPTGALLALTGENLWAQRKYSATLVWASKVPGDGRRMLQAYREWIQENRSIRVAGFQPDCIVDARAAKLLSRHGFNQRGGAHLLFN